MHLTSPPHAPRPVTAGRRLTARVPGSAVRVGQTFALRIVGVAFLFLAETRVALLLGPEGYGSFSYAVALAGLLALLVSWGWPAALPRFLPEYLDSGEWGLARGVVVRGSQLTLLTASVVGAGLWLGARWAGEPGMATGLRFAALLLPLLALLMMERRVFQGLRRPVASVVPEEVLLPAAFLALLVVLQPSRAPEALWMYVAVAGTVCAANAVWVRRSLPPQVRSAPPSFRTAGWVRVALPMAAGAVAHIVMSRTDLLMLGAMREIESAGLYGAAQRIAHLNIFFLGAVNVVVTPMLASAFHAGRGPRFRALIRTSGLASGATCVPILVVMLAWPGFLLGLFGPEFRAGENVLRILAVGQFINAATGSVGMALLMSGRQVPFAVTVGAVAAANALGNAVAIPLWGATGAAVVTAVSLASLNLWQWVLCRRIPFPAGTGTAPDPASDAGHHGSTR